MMEHVYKNQLEDFIDLGKNVTSIDLEMLCTGIGDETDFSPI